MGDPRVFRVTHEELVAVFAEWERAWQKKGWVSDRKEPLADDEIEASAVLAADYFLEALAKLRTDKVRHE